MTQDLAPMDVSSEIIKTHTHTHLHTHTLSLTHTTLSYERDTERAHEFCHASQRFMAHI